MLSLPLDEKRKKGDKIPMKWLFFILFPMLVFAVDEPSPPLLDSEQVMEETAPHDVSSDMYQKQFYRTFILILIIVVGSFALIWVMRKYSKDRPFQVNHKKNIKILERRQISPNTFLYHLQIGNKQVVISESKYEVKVIANLDWDESDPSV